MVSAADNSLSYDAWSVSYLTAFLNPILSTRKCFWFTIREVYHFNNVAPDATAVSDPIFRSLREVELADCCQTCEEL
jgi:hypothetical protein